MTYKYLTKNNYTNTTLDPTTVYDINPNMPCTNAECKVIGRDE